MHAIILYYISMIMSPFIRLLSLSTNSFLHLIGMKPDRIEEEVSEEEIKCLLETGQENGVFNDIEKEMITSIFSFYDKKAREVMIPPETVAGRLANKPEKDLPEEYEDEE